MTGVYVSFGLLTLFMSFLISSSENGYDRSSDEMVGATIMTCIVSGLAQFSMWNIMNDQGWPLMYNVAAQLTGACVFYFTYQSAIVWVCVDKLERLLKQPSWATREMYRSASGGIFLLTALLNIERRGKIIKSDSAHINTNGYAPLMIAGTIGGVAACAALLVYLLVCVIIRAKSHIMLPVGASPKVNFIERIFHNKDEK